MTGSASSDMSRSTGTASVGGSRFREIFREQPELFADHVGVPGQHDQAMPSDPAHLGDPGRQVSPVMHSQQRQGRVSAVVAERHVLSGCHDRGCCSVRPLADHGLARLDGGDSLGRLIRTRSRADVNDRRGSGQRLAYLRCDPRVSPAGRTVSAAQSVIQRHRHDPRTTVAQCCLSGMSVRFVRQAGSHAVRPTAMRKAWKKSWPGCRIDTSAFVEKVSGSRLGCP